MKMQLFNILGVLAFIIITFDNIYPICSVSCDTYFFHFKKILIFIGTKTFVQHQLYSNYDLPRCLCRPVLCFGSTGAIHVVNAIIKHM